MTKNNYNLYNNCQMEFYKISLSRNLIDGGEHKCGTYFIV